MQKLIFFICLLVSHIALAADVSVTATLDRTQITLEDEVTLTVTVAGDSKATDPVMPSIPAFKVAGQGSSSAIQIINGTMSFRKEFTYVLIPLSEGKFTIAPISVFAGGIEYKSQPLEITVGRSAQIPQAAPPGIGMGQEPVITPENDASKPYWISTTVSNLNPYVKEQILFTFRFYTRVELMNAVLSLPEFKDFQMEELVPEKKYFKDIDGVQYAVNEKVLALFPLHAGKIEVPQTVLRVDVPQQSSSRNSFFNDPFFNRLQTKPKNLIAKAIPIEVRDLPDAPTNFTGLIGNWGIQVGLSQSEVKVGDSPTLSIELAGRGNAADGILPFDFKLDSFRIYPDKPQLDLSRRESGLEGKKTFKLALVPSKEGTYSIPAHSLSYFDPNSSSYIDLKTPELSLTVTPGAEGAMPPATEPEPQDKPIESKPNSIPELSMPKLPSFNWGWIVALIGGLVWQFWVTVLLGILLAIVLIWAMGRWLRAKLRNPERQRKKRAWSEFEKQLRHSPQDAVKSYFGARMERPASGLTLREILNYLEGKQCDPALQKELTELFQTWERQSYAGMEVPSRTAEPSSCKHLFKKIHATLP